MIITATVGSSAQDSGLAPELAGGIAGIIGATGVAVSALRPSGQVEVAGRRYEARVEVGVVDPGTPIVVRGRSDFGLVVEKA
jgi:membrane-bound serine protease (ClpP class)